MKKFSYFIIAIALSSLMFMSCRKDGEKTYTCQCISLTTGVGTESFQVTADNDNEAENNCNGEAKAGEACHRSY